MLPAFLLFKMSRRSSTLSNRSYRSKSWSFFYTPTLLKNAASLHQTLCLDFYLRLKLSQKKVASHKRLVR